MSEIEDYGVTVEEYLEGMAAGIDILELRRSEAIGIPTNLVLELMTITKKVTDGTATPDFGCSGTNDFVTKIKATT